MVEGNRILAVDPGEKNLGIAVSDLTGTIANPLTVLDHRSREEDAQRIINLAEDQGAKKIIIGQALNWDGSLSFQARKAVRLSAALQEHSSIPIVLWNEFGSTQTAQDAQQAMGISRRRKGGPLDDLAATVILQSYLDAQEHEPPS